MGVNGPGGAVETSASTDKVGGIGHFYAIPVMRHPALYLVEGLFIFGNAEGGKDKYLVGLEPVNVGPAVLGEMIDIVVEFVNLLEMGLQDIPEPCRPQSGLFHRRGHISHSCPTEG